MSNGLIDWLLFVSLWAFLISVDARDGADLGAAEQWSSGGDVLGQRATFRADRHPAVLFLTNVKPKDEGLYRCRVDFRLSQTRNALVNLTVIGKPFPLLPPPPPSFALLCAHFTITPPYWEIDTKFIYLFIHQKRKKSISRVVEYGRGVYHKT